MELTREDDYTREELLAIVAENCQCYSGESIRLMAKQLLAEMDKPKVWEGAHEWQDRARVKHYSNSALCAMDETFKDYTRALPKSRIDEIAEEAEDKYRRGAVGAGSLTDIIKSAILRALEEKEANR